MKRMPVIISLAVLLTGCIYTSMSHLNEDELSWISPYSEDATVLFVSNKGNTDTLRYVEKNIWNTLNPFYINEGSSGVYDATASYDYIITNDSSSFDGYFLIRKDHKTNIIGALFDLNGTIADTDLFEDIPLKPNVREVVINNIKYPNCFIADSSNSRLSGLFDKTKQTPITKFIISRTEGLIYYKFADGEIFIRKQQ